MRRHVVLALVLAATLAPFLARAHEPNADKMQTYYLVLLRRGAKAAEVPKEKLQAIQEGHLANITKLSREGKLVLAGPFADDGDLRGIFLLNVTSAEEAQKLCDTDPAIRAGRLVAEIHPWYGPKGIRSDLTPAPEGEQRKTQLAVALTLDPSG